MESRHEPALVMFDGGVASIVSAWLELSAAECDEHARLTVQAKGERKSGRGGGDSEGRGGKQGSGGSGDGGDGGGGGVLVPAGGPRLWVMTGGSGGLELPAGLVRARVLAASRLVELGPMHGAMREVGLQREVGVRHALVSRLVEAAYTAVGLGLRRVVWPMQCGGVDRPNGVGEDDGIGVLDAELGVRGGSRVHGAEAGDGVGGNGGGGGGGDLDSVSEAWDKAVLVSRIASLDTPGVQIETPFLDLCDAELIALGSDLGAPVELAWVCEDASAAAGGNGEPCGVCAGCLRWLVAVRGEGVVSVKTRGVGVDSIRPRRKEPPSDGRGGS